MILKIEKDKYNGVWEQNSFRASSVDAPDLKDTLEWLQTKIDDILTNKLNIKYYKREKF